MSGPKGYDDVEYLVMLSRLAQQYKQRTYALMHIQPGHKVLDVGCGPGTDTIALASLVGPTGQVVGVDWDAAMVAEADKLAAEAQVGAWVRHQREDATALTFPAGGFDACRSERLFQHLAHPAQALSEMVRVTRSGGWVVVLDTDWGTLVWDTPEAEIGARLARVKAERCTINGYSGRQLYRLCRNQGLVDISVEICPVYGLSYAVSRLAARLDEVEREALAAGIVTAEELDRWHAGLEAADAAGVFFASCNMVLVAGRKP